MSFKLSIFLLSIVSISFCNLVLVVYFIMGKLGHWVCRESWAHKSSQGWAPRVLLSCFSVLHVVSSVFYVVLEVLSLLSLAGML